MTCRAALIVGNSEYVDPALVRLAAPLADVEGLAALLRDPEVGGFDETKLLVNEPWFVIQSAVADFLADRTPEDLLLLYFSGHGVRHLDGRLYLACRDTWQKRLAGTSVAAKFVSEEMERSASRRQVLILDCCHSGAFEPGTKGIATAGSVRAFTHSGYGRVVLTATDELQFASEGEQTQETPTPSLFTRHLIEGLRTGAADADNDGRVTLDELYFYVSQRVRADRPQQTPEMAGKIQGELVVAMNSHLRPKLLPVELGLLIDNELPSARQAAVRDLARLARSADLGLALAAVQALDRLTHDDSRHVAAAAVAALVDTPSTVIAMTGVPKPSRGEIPPLLPEPARPHTEGPGTPPPSWFRRNLPIIQFAATVALIVVVGVGVVRGYLWARAHQRSRTPEPSKPETDSALRTPDVAGPGLPETPPPDLLLKQLQENLRAVYHPEADLGALTKEYVPTSADYAAVFAAPLAELAEAYYTPLWADDEMHLAPVPGASAAVLHYAKADALGFWAESVAAHFHPGYRQVARGLQKNLTIFAEEVPVDEHDVVPNMWVFVNGHWRVFPAPWRIAARMVPNDEFHYEFALPAGWEDLSGDDLVQRSGDLFSRGFTAGTRRSDGLPQLVMYEAWYAHEPALAPSGGAEELLAEIAPWRVNAALPCDGAERCTLADYLFSAALDDCVFSPAEGWLIEEGIHTRAGRNARDHVFSVFFLGGESWVLCQFTAAADEFDAFAQTFLDILASFRFDDGYGLARQGAAPTP